MYVDAAVATSLSIVTATSDTTASSRAFSVVPGTAPQYTIFTPLQAENILSVTMTVY